MNYTVTGKGSYLLVPVWVGQEEKSVSLSIDGGEDIFLKLPLYISAKPVGGAFLEPTFFASIPAFSTSESSLQRVDNNHTLLLVADEDLGESILSLFTFSDSVPQIQNRGRRPFVHFTAKTGWINDPNGMVYKDGIYHLYFQYNPFNTKWENMCWGHAVSSDLLHWEQKDTVMFPNKEAHIFSGSGIVNSHSLLNLSSSALIFFYTYATPRGEENRAFTQKIACSTDNGTSFVRSKGNFLSTIAPENRDPKVFYHKESSSYICVLWLKESSYCILRSNNLTEWTETQRISLPPAWECPDLFRLKCSQTGESKWVFWSADGYYLVGSFDGYTFEAEQEMQKTYLTALPYAAQTFSNTEDKVISIAWLRMQNEGELYRGAMSLPRSFSLVQKQDGKYCLSHSPTEQYKASLKEYETKTFTGVYDSSLEVKKAYEIKIEASKRASVIKVCLNDTEIFMCNIIEETATLSSKTVKMDNISELHLLIDENIAELTNKDYTCIAHWELPSVSETSKLKIYSEGECTAGIYFVGE